MDADARDAGKFSIAAGQGVALKLGLKIPVLDHLTPGAPLSLKVTDGVKTLFTTSLMSDGKLPLETSLPADVLSGKPGTLYVSVYFTHCSSGSNAVCTPGKSAWKLGVDYSGTGGIELK